MHACTRERVEEYAMERRTAAGAENGRRDLQMSHIHFSPTIASTKDPAQDWKFLCHRTYVRAVAILPPTSRILTSLNPRQIAADVATSCNPSENHLSPRAKWTGYRKPPGERGYEGNTSC